MAVETKRIMNGTFGELWLDGDYVGEAYKAQAKVEFNKEEIKQCGTFFTDNKLVGCKGTGSFRGSVAPGSLWQTETGCG